jgi:hypothetical protein
MKTDELISMLATGGVAVEPHAAQRRYVTALGWGAFAATLLMALWLGVRRDIAAAYLLPMFWVKLAFPGAILAGALIVAQRLSRPGARLGHALIWLAAPVLAIWLLATVALLAAAPVAREHLIYGISASVCPYYIALLSVPAFIAAWWAMKGLAPTRPLAAGAASGLVAGALGALAYALHCPEMAAPFLGIWYVQGMLIPAIAGALLGPFLLRW